MDLNGEFPYNLPSDPLIPGAFGGQIFSHISSFVDKSLYRSRYDSFPGWLALGEALSSVSRTAGAFFWFAGSSSSFGIRSEVSDIGAVKSGQHTSCKQVKHIASCEHNFIGVSIGSKSGLKSTVVDKFLCFSIRHLFIESDKLWSVPALSLAAAIVPPFDNLNQNIVAFPLENEDSKLHGSFGKRCCEVGYCGRDGFSVSDLNWGRCAIEPKTGIEFPTILKRILPEKNKSRSLLEVLVGTGSKTMKIIRVKTLKVYAFGFYIHPPSVCQKLGHKYASASDAQLNKCNDFYEDLLREDIGMTLRLVVNCNGMKVNTVRDAFEKSLRARLLKVNPETDYNCLRTFRSYFTQDISLPVGTTIDFRRTSDGQLITEIGGTQVGAVHSRELCRAFFDMYIGDFPVSEQTKEEIGENVISIIRRC